MDDKLLKIQFGKTTSFDYCYRKYSENRYREKNMEVYIQFGWYFKQHENYIIFLLIKS